MTEQEIEKRIRVSDWVKPLNQMISLSQCYIRFNFLLNATNKWEYYNFFAASVIKDDDSKKMTKEQLDYLKETKIDFAKQTLVRKFNEIKEKKECFFAKSDETLYIEDGDSEDTIEDAKFNSEWAKSKNENLRRISYKETDEGFYVKVDEIRVTD